MEGEEFYHLYCIQPPGGSSSRIYAPPPTAANANLTGEVKLGERSKVKVTFLSSILITTFLPSGIKTVRLVDLWTKSDVHQVHKVMTSLIITDGILKIVYFDLFALKRS